ncbi:MAG TPA: FlgD immunoglobulin-like domain containing protein [bacterium]|nr:FlgD immunoglobulin-like domain containing protein [bacterium]
MPDLRADYFQRDLSADEDDALAGQIDANDDFAVGFAVMAAQDYQLMGLPKPVWPQRRGRRMGLWLALGALAAGGTWIWQAGAPDSQAVVPVGVVPGVERQQTVEDRVQQDRVQDEATAPSAPQPLPRLKVRAGNGGFAASLIPAADDRPELQVLDRQGRQVCRLPPDGQGSWLWNGQDADSKPVAQGAYQFKVELNGRALTQWVQVRRSLRAQP